MITDPAEWYVQKGARVQGPFSATEVGRFLMLGRVRRSDRVSRDGELWEPVTQVPELVPEELLNLDAPEGLERLSRARAAGDERDAGTGAGIGDRSPRGASGGPAGPRPARGAPADPGIRLERRAGADMLWRVREEWRLEEAAQPVRPARVRASLLPWSLFCLTLVALGVVLWLDRAALPVG